MAGQLCFARLQSGHRLQHSLSLASVVKDGLREMQRGGGGIKQWRTGQEAGQEGSQGIADTT